MDQGSRNCFSETHEHTYSSTVWAWTGVLPTGWQGGDIVTGWLEASATMGRKKRLRGSQSPGQEDLRAERERARTESKAGATSTPGESRAAR